MKKAYIAPAIKEHDIEVSQMICASVPSNNDGTDETIKGEEALSNRNNDNWSDWGDDNE